MRSASPDGDCLADRVGRYASKSILTPVLEDKGNSLRQILTGRIHGYPLTVSPRDFGAVRYIPIVCFLNHCREFVSQFAHTPVIKRQWALRPHPSVTCDYPILSPLGHSTGPF